MLRGGPLPGLGTQLVSLLGWSSLSEAGISVTHAWTSDTPYMWLSLSWLPGSFHPGQEVTFSSCPGLPAQKSQNDLAIVVLRLERHSPGLIFLLSSLNSLFDLHLFLGTILEIVCTVILSVRSWMLL